MKYLVRLCTDRWIFNQYAVEGKCLPRAWRSTVNYAIHTDVPELVFCIQQVARWMRNDTRTAKEATAAASWFTRSVDGVTAARAGKQLVIKDRTPCKDVSVPLDRPVGGEG